MSVSRLAVAKTIHAAMTANSGADCHYYVCEMPTTEAPQAFSKLLGGQKKMKIAARPIRHA